jgi:multidrug efflux pump subunit AcrA (membrane-fusion protein)
LAVLGASGATLLKLKVDEADIRKIKVGQQVLVRLDILPDSIFEARVSRVYPRLNRKEQAFTVDAVFNQEPGLNLSGLNAEANIIIQKRAAVLTIPKTLLQNDSVWLLKEGKEVAQRVRTGISDDEWIEIVAGLNENDVLIQR